MTSSFVEFFLKIFPLIKFLMFEVYRKIRTVIKITIFVVICVCKNNFSHFLDTEHHISTIFP